MGFSIAIKLAPLAIVAVSLLQGCASTNSVAADVPESDPGYSNRLETLNATKRTYQDAFVGVKRHSAPPIKGKAVVLVPPRYVLVGAIVGQNPSLPGWKSEYAAELAELRLTAIGHSLKVGNVFETIVLSRKSGDVETAKPDYVVYVPPQIINDRYQWFVARPSAKENKIAIDPRTSSNGAAMFNAFNDATIAAVKSLGGGAAAEKATVKVSSGTGFFIGNRGYAMTNAHVVANCRSLIGILRDKRQIPLQPRAIDRTNDLAVVYAKGFTRSGAKFRADAPQVGEQIVAFGYPLSNVLTTSGIVTEGIISANAGLADDARKLQFSAPIQPGNSGGPLLDLSGNVIGVVSSTLNSLSIASATGAIPQNVNFAIKSAIARSFLESNDIQYETGKPAANKSVADAAERAKDFSFRIICR